VLKKSKRSSFAFEIILWIFHLKTLTRPNSSTWETDVYKGLVAYAKCNRDSYESMLGCSFSYCPFLFR